MTVNRTRVNRMKNYYIHHYTINADTICKALNYIFKPNSNYRLGFKFFFADENIFLTEKIKRYLQNNGIVFSYAIFKTCRILWTVFVVVRFSWWIPHLPIGRIGIRLCSGKQKRVFLGLEVIGLLSRKPDNCIHTWWFRSVSCRCCVLFY